MYSYEKEIIYALDELEVVVTALKKAMKHCQVFAITGSLGAGKTTTIKALLRNCGVEEVITSPTFTYVNEYHNSSHERFYHFDLYRIQTIEEFQSQGFDEYLYQPHSWSFIEWPEVIMPLLTHGVCRVDFDYHEDSNKRVVIIRYNALLINQ